ncbi:hypothetical protein GWK47_024531 [Chionoecetes opilio]|uniref:Uncharacterized protein n=1 Tax=Chionoecetes opilio TaxID=41210 RepID=A0A8J5CCE1_CHIOP|nr:hypothetical protein GWK47_024531 [Chionoecetes opilio]
MTAGNPGAMHLLALRWRHRRLFRNVNKTPLRPHHMATDTPDARMPPVASRYCCCVLQEETYTPWSEAAFVPQRCQKTDVGVLPNPLYQPQPPTTSVPQPQLPTSSAPQPQQMDGTPIRRLLRNTIYRLRMRIQQMGREAGPGAPGKGEREDQGPGGSNKGSPGGSSVRNVQRWDEACHPGAVQPYGPSPAPCQAAAAYPPTGRTPPSVDELLSEKLLESPHLVAAANFSSHQKESTANSIYGRHLAARASSFTLDPRKFSSFGSPMAACDGGFSGFCRRRRRLITLKLGSKCVVIEISQPCQPNSVLKSCGRCRRIYS